MNAETFASITPAPGPEILLIALQVNGLNQESKTIKLSTNIEDENRKWVFAKIEDNHFHWQDVTVKEGVHIKHRPLTIIT